jgi:type III secretory pathway lipoprotein EscJ
LGHLISPCYGPFSLGTRFETYEKFIYFILQFISGCGKLLITETADAESADMGANCTSHENMAEKNFTNLCSVITVQQPEFAKCGHSVHTA